jgi:transposase InsO family protein
LRSSFEPKIISSGWTTSPGVDQFFKTLKSELVWRTIFYTRQEADQAIGRYIDGFYNPVRRHSALDFISPAQFEKMAAE